MRTAVAVLVCTAGLAFAQQRADPPDDPFLQITSGIAQCPAPPASGITDAQRVVQAHGRAERGTTCYLAGRCRLPNSYLYDREIIPRVKKAVEFDGRFAQTSVWAEGQRRWVWLKGCVRRQEDAQALEQLVRGIDDVEAVVDELVVTGP